MKQTTNYILLFSLLVSLKFNNNDTIKIGISLLITYIVYQLFKRNNIENFYEPRCSPSPPGNTIDNGCRDIVGSDSPDASCVSTSDARCDCDTSGGGWKRIGSTYYSNTFAGRPSPPPSKVGKCFCDPYNSETVIASPCYNDSSPKNYTSCKAWSKIPGCPPGTILISGTENNPMGEDPDNTCCSSHRPGPTPTSCSPSPCPENSYCASSTAPNCVCEPEYIGSPPNCSPREQDPCEGNNCDPTKERCVPSASGSTYTCECSPPYTGSAPNWIIPEVVCPTSPCPKNSYCDSSTAPNCVCSPGYSKDPDEPSSTCELGYFDYMKDMDWYWWVLLAIGFLVLVFAFSWRLCCWPYTIFSTHGRHCDQGKLAEKNRRRAQRIEGSQPSDENWFNFGPGGSITSGGRNRAQARASTTPGSESGYQSFGSLLGGSE